MAKKTAGDDAAAQDERDQGEQEEQTVALVHMVRDVSQHPGGPVEADVHPDEVANYTAADWRVVEAKVEG